MPSRSSTTTKRSGSDPHNPLGAPRFDSVGGIEVQRMIDYYKCQDCQLTELGIQDAEIHEHHSGHTVVPVYV
jgi:hypothetical protein